MGLLGEARWLVARPRVAWPLLRTAGFGLGSPAQEEGTESTLLVRCLRLLGLEAVLVAPLVWGLCLLEGCEGAPCRGRTGFAAFVSEFEPEKGRRMHSANLSDR